MNNLIQAVVVTLFAASTAQAQQAVQWKVSDGGNGHWYRVSRVAETWGAASARCASAGGHLATLTSQSENSFAVAMLADTGTIGAWIGGRQAPTSCEPGCGWYWISGEDFVFSTWRPGEPNNYSNEGLNEDALVLQGSAWNDFPSVLSSPGLFALCEWSADCNGDGIVDYGQCHDGTLPDYNGNNIPDCCERAEACVVGNYPVQWRTEDGGNGHWYQRILFAGTAGCSTCPPYMCQATAADYAQQRGAFLVSIGSLAEGAFAGNGLPPDS